MDKRTTTYLMGTYLMCVLLLLAAPAAAQEVRTTPLTPGSQLIRDGDVVEVFVDEQGKIYRELRYHGIIPSIRDSLTGKPPQPSGRSKITWVGFQQKQFYSRVFIQTNQLSRFTLHKPDPRHIVVTFERARIPRRNTLRPIITGEFSTSVEQIRARRRGGRAQVIITLSKPVGYLYKQQGNYVFIDVER